MDGTETGMEGGTTDVCIRKHYVLVVPFDDGRSDGDERENPTSIGFTSVGVKMTMIFAWIAICATFAAMRVAVGGEIVGAAHRRIPFDRLLVDSLGRTIGISVAEIAAQQYYTGSEQRFYATASALRGTLDAFALVCTTFYSSWLFYEQMAQPEPRRRRIHSLGELLADTQLLITFMTSIPAERVVFRA